MCEACVPRGVSRRTVVGAIAAAPLVFGAATRRASAASVRPALDEPVSVAEGLLIHRRDAWARTDMPPLGPMVAEDVKFLIVHHTATGNTYRADDATDMVRGVYRAQTTEKGWPDTCYNFLIDRFGGVWEGRAGSLDAAVTVDATGGSQGFAQLVCLIGDFTSVMPSAEMLASLQKTLAWMAGRFSVSTDPAARVTFTSRGSNRWPVGTEITTGTIVGHREMSATACPGDEFYPFVREALPGQVHRYVQNPATAGRAGRLPEVM
jgi:N-acetylmuramoyl-L-alanine amidase